MNERHEVRTTAGNAITILGPEITPPDRYLDFFDLGPNLAVGHVRLGGAHYLQVFKRDGDVYVRHGNLRLEETEGNAVEWHLDLVRDGSSKLNERARHLLAKSARDDADGDGDPFGFDKQRVHLLSCTQETAPKDETAKRPRRRPPTLGRPFRPRPRYR